MAYRKAKFCATQGIIRGDEVLLQAEGEATCWLRSCKLDCINLTVHPAELCIDPGKCEPAFPKAPIPNCDRPEIKSKTYIQPLDPKLCGADACIILERKNGCDHDKEATAICVLDLSADAMVDGVFQWKDIITNGRNGFIRARLVRKGKADVFVRLHMERNQRPTTVIDSGSFK